MTSTKGDGQDMASPADAGRAAGLRPQPQAASRSSIPDAETYTTVVVKHADAEASQAFIQFAHANWPFLRDDPPVTQMTAISVGDVMSVQEAMRCALECDELARDERVEFALDLDAHCYTWAECLAYAEEEWELAYRGGQFVDAQGIEAGTDETATQARPEGQEPGSQSECAPEPKS